MGLNRSEGTVSRGGRSQLLPQPEPVPTQEFLRWSHIHAPQNHSWGILPCAEPKVHQGKWKISMEQKGLAHPWVPGKPWAWRQVAQRGAPASSPLCCQREL